METQQRQIKFRVWDKAENEFSDVSEYDSWNWFDRFRDPKIPESLTIQQYTGLKDKNGVEIYEGDILKYDFLGVALGQAVIWNPKNGAWNTTKEHGGNTGDWFEYYEVIGNIFENPELLEA